MSLLFDGSAEDWLPDRLARERKTSPAKKVQDEHLLSLPTLTNKTGHILNAPGTLYRAANLQGLDE
jgi:hypothetical protein